MQNRSRRDFLRASAGLATTTVAVPASLWGCVVPPDAYADINTSWEKRAEQLESNGVLTGSSPGPWAGKEALHIPTVTFNSGGGTVTVTTPHGMARDHWITTIYVRNQEGVVVGLQEFTGLDPAATATFNLPPGTTWITAYSYCSLHDHWSAARQKVEG